MRPSDLERQAFEDERGSEIITDNEEMRTVPLDLDSEIARKNHTDISFRTAQFCFLCVHERKYGHYAVRVPCFRPTRWRRTLSRLIFEDADAQDEKITYAQLDPMENACESDAAIYERLKRACFQHQNRWKQWVPFYGIVDVREVNFQFLGGADKTGRFPIHVYSISISEIRKEADQAIALEPDNLDIENACGGDWHSRECMNIMEMLSLPCVMDQAEAGRQRKKKLDILYLLKDCARDPPKANGLRTLEGLAQESCIMDTKANHVVAADCQSLLRADTVPGLQFILGWERDRMSLELPVRISWTLLGLAMIWLCVVLLGGSAKEWDIAMAFGQLLVASIALLLCILRD